MPPTHHQQVLPSHGWELSIACGIQHIHLESVASDFKVVAEEVLHCGRVFGVEGVEQEPPDDGRLAHI